MTLSTFDIGTSLFCQFEELKLTKKQRFGGLILNSLSAANEGKNNLLDFNRPFLF